MLGPVLAQPLQQHNWVKIDLVRCSPSSLPEHKQQLNGDSSGWLVQHVAEVLPVMPRGDQDLKDTLVELGWETQAAAPRWVAKRLAMLQHVFTGLFYLACAVAVVTPAADKGVCQQSTSVGPTTLVKLITGLGVPLQ